MGHGKYADFIQELENDEMESIMSVESYIQLLAAYLYQNELAEARYLWKRIPQVLKAENKELERLFVLLCALFNNDTAEFFKKIIFPWPDSIKNIMEDLLKRMQQDVLTLVGQAYISIFEQHLLQLTQLPREQLKEACLALGWTYENDGPQAVIIPKRPTTIPNTCASSEELLFKLTDFVSFLEN